MTAPAMPVNCKYHSGLSYANVIIAQPTITARNAVSAFRARFTDQILREWRFDSVANGGSSLADCAYERSTAYAIPPATPIARAIAIQLSQRISDFFHCPSLS